jgi:hypothetical protein
VGEVGTDAVTEGWLEAVWDYRLYASSALGKTHSDTTVRKCLELLPQDKDLDIRTSLADALLAAFGPDFQNGDPNNTGNAISKTHSG